MVGFSGDDGYICPVCSQKFRYPNALKSHLKSFCRTAVTASGPLGRRDSSRTKDSARLGSAFRRVAPRSFGDSNSFCRTPVDVVDNGPSRMDKCCDRITLYNAAVSHSNGGEVGSAFKPHTKTELQTSLRRSPKEKEKVGFRVFSKTNSPSSTQSTENSINNAISSTDAARKESSVLFSVDKMLNHPVSKNNDSQSSSGDTIRSPTALDKNANPFDPLAFKTQLSIPTGIGTLHRPLDPYAHIPFRCFQPVMPTIARYGSILPPVHHRELYNGATHPYFPYKVPIPGPLKFVQPPHPIPPPHEMDLSKFAGLDHSHLPVQGTSSSFQVGETQYSYLQETSRKNKRGHLCIYCGKLYSRKYGLKIHLRTHTGYKPLKCKVCLRPFGDPSNLNKHIRLHAEGDTPYRCEYCGKVLVRRRDLDRHIRSRHPAESARREEEKKRLEEEEEEEEEEGNGANGACPETEDEDVDMLSLGSPESKRVHSGEIGQCLNVQNTK